MLSWLSGLYKLSKNMQLYLKVSLELHLGQQENVVKYMLKINVYLYIYLLCRLYYKAIFMYSHV